MAIYKLPHFGAIDSSALEDYYETDIDFNNTIIQVDLNFDNKSIDTDRLDVVKHFIENIRIHDLKNKKYIEEDFNEEGGTVREYLDYHINELPTDDLDELIGSNAKSAEQPKLLLKKLKLVRVGLFPDSKEEFAIFDYSLGRELTNHMVVIFTDENGNMDYMTMES